MGKLTSYGVYILTLLASRYGSLIMVYVSYRGVRSWRVVTLAKPMWRWRMAAKNMLPTTPIRSYFKALSVTPYSLCSLDAMVWEWRRAKICAAVALWGMVASGPGLGSGTKGMWDRVLNTVGSTARKRGHMRPVPRCKCIDAALALRKR